MRRITASIFFISILLLSCAKDNDDVINTELEGKWTLTHVSCFCGFGENPDFSGHKITFNGSMLNVENTGEFQFLTDATGSYTVDGNVITLKNGRQYTYVIKEDKLQLTFVDNPQIADDELFLEYEGS
ncbi:MAG: lipocalin family protein [Aurantibacter sp.]